MQTTNVNVNVNLYSASSQKNASNAVIHNAKVRWVYINGWLQYEFVEQINSLCPTGDMQKLQVCQKA